MRSHVVRRTALTASAAALALLVTACGGSSEGGGDDSGKAGGDKAAQADKTPSAAPAKALTAEELEKAALTQEDVKSGKVTTKVPAADDVAQDKVRTDDRACDPLAHLQAGSYVGKPSATVKRSWLGDVRKPEAGAKPEEATLAALEREKVIVTLASYEDGGAEQAMKDLTKAAAACSGGFAYTANGNKIKIVKVAVGDAPQGADEALAVNETMDAEGVKAPVKGVVVRKGATLAYFSAANLASVASGKDFDFPTELVEAQLAKLK
ncbi:hypothetical protein ACFQWA_17350 [Streptomyces thermogriseus]|uniref:Lipoprotein n=1 Tax=Streptomyces thermogriseus TaxID=75292 RepID=A0ABN1T4K1_9ACTN